MKPESLEASRDMNSRFFLVVDLNLNNLCNLDLVILKAMFTQNIQNEGLVELKMIPVNMSVGRF